MDKIELFWLVIAIFLTSPSCLLFLVWIWVQMFLFIHVQMLYHMACIKTLLHFEWYLPIISHYLNLLIGWIPSLYCGILLVFVICVHQPVHFIFLCICLNHQLVTSEYNTSVSPYLCILFLFIGYTVYISFNLFFMYLAGLQ